METTWEKKKEGILDLCVSLSLKKKIKMSTTSSESGAAFCPYLLMSIDDDGQKNRRLSLSIQTVYKAICRIQEKKKTSRRQIKLARLETQQTVYPTYMLYKVSMSSSSRGEKGRVLKGL